MIYSPEYCADDIELISDEWVFKGYFGVRRIELRHKLFKGGWSSPVKREIFERGDAVAVLPYDPVADELVLIEQFRPGAMRAGDTPWMLELIAGVVEPGEGDEQVAHREAFEEAQCTLSELELIATFYPSAGACSEQIRGFIGRVEVAPQSGVFGLESENEDIKLHRLPFPAVMDLLRSNQINNGHTLIALQWLALNRDALRERWLS
jgi:ADP-ribose pyrophosphatase